jgi:hypothetical protein
MTALGVITTIVVDAVLPHFDLLARGNRLMHDVIKTVPEGASPAQTTTHLLAFEVLGNGGQVPFEPPARSSHQGRCE